MFTESTKVKAINDIKNGATHKFVAKKYKASVASVGAWLKNEKLASAAKAKINTAAHHLNQKNHGYELGKLQAENKALKDAFLKLVTSILNGDEA